MRLRHPWTRAATAALSLAAIACAVDTETGQGRPTAATGTQGAPDWAADVVIHRDEWGVPHIKASTDAAVAFGSAWAQCEDHFFQLEDTYIKALGRYSEVVGESGFRSDLEVALFDLVGTSRRDFPALPENIQRISEAFAAGYNDYLEKHPEEKPRLLTRMEPFHVLAFERYMILGRLLGAAHAPRGRLAPLAAELAASLGSNQWAVGPSKTRDGNAMLFINPHQPWYGSGDVHRDARGERRGLELLGRHVPGRPVPDRRLQRAARLGVHGQRRRHLGHVSPDLRPPDRPSQVPLRCRLSRSRGSGAPRSTCAPTTALSRARWC